MTGSSDEGNDMISASVLSGGLRWADTAPGVARAVLATRPELMLVAFRFELGAVGAPHSHPHVQASFVAEGSFDVTINGATTHVAAGASFIVAPRSGPRCRGAGGGSADRRLRTLPGRFPLS